MTRYNASCPRVVTLACAESALTQIKNYKKPHNKFLYVYKWLV